MADVQQKQKTAAKLLIKKKKWYEVVAPKYFGDYVIGECYLEEPSAGVGRRIVTSMMTITGEPQKQNVSLHFQLTNAENSKLIADITGYRIIPSAVRKMMRRGKSKIEDSFALKTADNVLVRVKPILITRNRGKGSILAALKKKEREFFAKNIPKQTFEALIKDILSQKIQHDLSAVLKKIYPVAVCEVRMFHIETVKKTKVLEVAPEKTEAKTEEAPEVQESAPKAEA